MTTHTRPTWPALKVREMAAHPEVFAAYDDFLAAVRRGERVTTDRPLIVVERPEDLPVFASEDEEHEFWGTHDMGEAFYRGAVLPPEVRDALARVRASRAAGP